MKTERTPLTADAGAQTFQWSILHSRKQKLHQFQCCLCAIFLALVITFIVIIVSYLTSDELKEAIDAGTAALNERDDFEETSTVLLRSSPSYKHQKAIATSIRANQLARVGFACHKATAVMSLKQKR